MKKLIPGKKNNEVWHVYEQEDDETNTGRRIRNEQV